MKKTALMLALALGLSSTAIAGDATPLVVRDAAGNIISVGGLAPGVAVVGGIVIIAGVAYMVSEVGDNFVVVATATGT